MARARDRGVQRVAEEPDAQVTPHDNVTSATRGAPKRARYGQRMPLCARRADGAAPARRAAGPRLLGPCPVFCILYACPRQPHGRVASGCPFTWMGSRSYCLYAYALRAPPAARRAIRDLPRLLSQLSFQMHRRPKARLPLLGRPAPRHSWHTFTRSGSRPPEGRPGNTNVGCRARVEADQ